MSWRGKWDVKHNIYITEGNGLEFLVNGLSPMGIGAN